jgi:hypothetical protein
MNYRLATILAREQHIADITRVIDIDLADPVSQLVISYESDNNPTGANATAHPARCITRIEVIDGSEVLYSLSGQEAQGVDFYHNKVVPTNIMNYLVGNYHEMIYKVNFGRFLFDPVLALDPRKFTNLQLRISINIDGGGDEANDGFLTVMAHIFDDKKISPTGVLTAKEIKSYLLAATAHEYTDLPTDLIYKQIFLRCQGYGNGPEAQLANIKLTEDNDRKIPLDATIGQYIRNMLQLWPTYDEWILVWGQVAAQFFYNTPCYWPTFTDTQWRAAVAVAEASIFSGDGGQFTHSAEGAGPNHQIHCKGWAPHAMLPLLPDLGVDLADWYDPTKIGNLKLDVTAGAAPVALSTGDIVVQQIKKY